MSLWSSFRSLVLSLVGLNYVLPCQFCVLKFPTFEKIWKTENPHRDKECRHNFDLEDAVRGVPLGGRRGFEVGFVFPVAARGGTRSCFRVLGGHRRKDMIWFALHMSPSDCGIAGTRSRESGWVAVANRWVLMEARPREKFLNSGCISRAKLIDWLVERMWNAKLPWTEMGW